MILMCDRLTGASSKHSNLLEGAGPLSSGRRLMHAHPHHPVRPRSRALVLAALISLPLTACGVPATSSPEVETTTAEQAASEEAASTPRLALTYDGGIQVLDATTLAVVADIELDGFNRLNPAGDERHVFVSTSGGFQVLDVGSWAEPHGDHAHYYSTQPSLVDVVYPADVPGHVVVHHGRTVLFDDATGVVTVLDSAEVADTDAQLREHRTPSAHHGVAVELEDGSLFVSEGTEDARTGAVVLDADGTQVAASGDCPGLHGETVAEHETVVVGCEDGALVYHEGEFTKVAAPDEFGRIGNLRSVEGSEVVLGDYNADAEDSTLTQVALIDIEGAQISIVDLDTEYTFRSLARDEEGHALVLGTDGEIHVIDVDSAQIERSIPVIDAWEVPQEWQQPRPTLLMLDGSAYVTDPINQRLVAVDVETGEVWNEALLDVAPNEVVGVTGDVVDGVSHESDTDHAGDDADH
jgi:hypothetical protein